VTNRIEVPYTYRFAEMADILDDEGLLLAATKPSGESNTMTIGWGTVGVIWGLPVFSVLVRPSRYTYEFIEASGEFTVNVPNPDMRSFVDFCGTRSGRDVNKFAEFNVATSPGQRVACSPIRRKSEHPPPGRLTTRLRLVTTATSARRTRRQRCTSNSLMSSA